MPRGWRIKPALTVAFLAVIVTACPLYAGKPATEVLGTMVVTAPPMSDPITVETDPKAARQPVPAADGATMLKNIPGFCVTRKGGTDGDPTFRGLAASRVNILLNGDHIFGGCGNRMDPPTAYIYPETFDTVRVIKGPQTVLYGGGNVAATVLFEKNTRRFTEPGLRFFGSLMAGGNERFDQVLDSSAGGSTGFARLTATNSQSGDYQDGNGRSVHSEYHRWNASGIVGWTPSDTTRLELNLDKSDGQAAYADRTMDGVKFDRSGLGLRFEKRNVSELLERVEFKVFNNYVDHVMDNYSLRTPAMTRMASNPDRTTRGGRGLAQINLGAKTFVIAGFDAQENEHTLRTASASGMSSPDVGSKSREVDADFQTLGVFTEINHQLGERSRLVGGLRLDKSEATARKTSAQYGGVAAGNTDSDDNLGAFLRYEQDLTALPATVFAGLGRAVRSPDYWERAKVFGLDTEKSSQLDLGMSFRGTAIEATASLFYTRIDDFILVQALSATSSTAANIDASLYGGEAELVWKPAPSWRANAVLAYTRGENETQNTALAQVAPLEGGIGLAYNDQVWQAGLVLRGVAKQNRVQVGYGSIVGQDIGETPGFFVLSVNGGYRPGGANYLFTAGVDNILDADYAEHISRSGAAVSGFEQTTRVNEPGRFFWIKAALLI